MEKIITYHKKGDYLIPDLVPPEDPHIGIWGRRRKRFLQQWVLYRHLSLYEKRHIFNGQIKNVFRLISTYVGQTIKKSAPNDL